MSYGDKLLFLVEGHTLRALLAMGLFGLGAGAAVPGLRNGVRWVVGMAEGFAGMLEWVMRRRPGVAGLALFIFGFNSTAMFVYMLTGVIPGAPFVIAFLTGLNVMAASAISSVKRAAAAPPRPLARACAALTFLLELPCFSYTIAMGSTITPNIVALVMGASGGEIAKRMVVYATVIVPVLAVSAVVEAYAVTARRD